MMIDKKVTTAIILLLLVGIAYNITQHFAAPRIVPAVPIVIEMFTSAYCPSCPPADKLLAQIGAQANIIALSCHVPYWDSPTRKDEFARDFCQVRQHGYASINDEKRIFTPQMMVNGAQSVIGYQTNAVFSALHEAALHPPKLIDLTVSKDGVVTIDLPALSDANKNLRIWAFGYGNDSQLTSQNEENNTPSTRPAISLDNLGAWNGGAETRQMKILNPSVKGLIVLAQDNGYSTILAAGRIDIDG